MRTRLLISLLAGVLVTLSASSCGAPKIATQSDGEVHEGYTKAQCEAVWGRPDHKTTYMTNGMTLTQWAYPDRGVYLYFAKGRLFKAAPFKIPENRKNKD